MSRSFPMIVPLAPRFVSHLIGCEYGSYEDHDKGKEERIVGSPHAVTILERRKSGIEIRTEFEAAEIYYAVASGTFQLAYTDGQGMKGALKEAKRIADLLRRFVKDPDVLRFTPNGY